MPRHIRAGDLENRTRLDKLSPSKKPVFVKIGPGVGLGYRRNETAGTWVVRASDGESGNWTRRIATADDFEDANGTSVLTFWQAQDRAREMARAGQSGEGQSSQPLDVRAALDRYEANLEARGADAANAQRARGHLPDALARRPVALLTKDELRKWRDGLDMAPASANRVATTLRAALNLAADKQEGITNRAAWQTGLKAIADATETRNVVVDDRAIRRIVAESYEESAEFGLLVELAAVTGARVSQIARLECRDVRDGHVTLPTSKKGKGNKTVFRKQTPIPPDTMAKLRRAAKGRAEDELLLLKPSGAPWQKSDHSRLFRRVVERAKLDPRDVTIYALRHSDITRHLKSGVPIRIVAALHDTSVAMIERTYSVSIDKHVDAIVRPALFKIGTGERKTGVNR